MRIQRFISTLVMASGLSAETPVGWHKSGSEPNAYEIEAECVEPHEGRYCGTIASIGDVKEDKLGTLMQGFKADEYRGKKIKLSAFIKTSEAAAGAWLWLRIDDTESARLDNMYERRIQGTTGWHLYSVVLPVSNTAIGISLGLALNGTGKAWIDDVKIEAVSAEAPTTGTIPERQIGPEERDEYRKSMEIYRNRPSHGVNLDFEQH